MRFSFTKPKENNSVKDTKNSLFSSEYIVRKSADEVASNETMNEEPISITIILLFGGRFYLFASVFIRFFVKVGGKVMAIQTHINVTVDFSKWNRNTYDLRIPNHQSIKYLLKTY